jgi:Transposase
MKVQISRSKNSESLYIAQSIRIGKKTTTKNYKKLGTIEEVRVLAGDMDPYEWAKQQAAYYTELENQNKKQIELSLSNHTLVKKGSQRQYNVGYLFLKKLYYELHLDKLCKSISDKYKFKYDLNAILSALIYARIIYPSSKLSTFESCQKLLEQQNFDLHHIYRALEVLAKESADIQTHLYKHSQKVVPRNTKVLYYDCTNFYFEINEAEDDKQYGIAKQYKPNPIVQMGLFLDGNGIPLAFNITPGNRNEQITLQPLEKQILKDFELSEVIVCTDAGLSSTSNRKFNDMGSRSYITVQSLKKTKDYIRQWALDTTGWSLQGTDKLIDISTITLENNYATYYKERIVKENGLDERLIVTFSPKYKLYQQKIRDAQIERAIKKINSGEKKRKAKNPNDPQRFILERSFTDYGEVSSNTSLTLDHERIQYERQFDGFYSVITNLDADSEYGSINEILRINRQRWEIEETFLIMKSEFKSRPVYLKNRDRIHAHFLEILPRLELIFKRTLTLYI